MNCFLYNDNLKVKNFYDEIFETGSVSLINKPTRVTTNSATLIDNIITSDIFNNDLKVGILRTDISDHFPIFLKLDNTNSEKTLTAQRVIRKRIYNEANLNLFKNQLSLLHWNNINFNDNANNIYESFFKTFFSVYDANFPIIENKITTKSLNTPWITKGFKKSSKIKQKLYINFLKTKTPKNEKIYKDYKNLFEKIRKNLKKNYYSQLLNTFKNDTKRTWQIMNEIIGKQKSCSGFLPQMVRVDNKSLYEPRTIAQEFNKFFIDIGPTLSKKIPNTKSLFTDFLVPIDNWIGSVELSSELLFEEFERAFKSLKKK
ncbi:uncharacterized protein LOC136096398 [Hydra vulgaris]|uniref:uncharacterized protein LOC136096398 n=1 Tax=Hydra vulgaris TaxID=6087 RepID=UPI0032EA04A1